MDFHGPQDDIPNTVRLLTSFREYAIPSTKANDLNATIGGNLSPEARRLLQSATRQRVTLTDGLDYGGSKVDPRNVVSAVAAYFPSIWKVMKSMEASASVNVKLNRELKFSWKTTLTSAGARKEEWTSQSVLLFEIAFCLVVKALAHFNTAKVIMHHAVGNNGEIDAQKFASASKELRVGAGILECAAVQLIPRWVSPPNHLPVEMLPKALLALKTIFLVQAQRLAAAKAIATNGKHSVIAKLLNGAADKYDEASGTLRKLSRDQFALVEHTTKDTLGTWPSILRGLAFKYIGIAKHEEGEWADAAGYLHLASAHLQNMTLGKTLVPIIGNFVNIEKRVVFEHCSEFANETNNVYFLAPTPPDQLALSKTHGVFIAKGSPFILPEPETVSFAEVEEELKEKGTEEGDIGASMEALGLEPLQPPAGVDPSVFNALPRSVQEDVIEQSKSNN